MKLIIKIYGESFIAEADKMFEYNWNAKKESDFITRERIKELLDSSYVSVHINHTNNTCYEAQ